MKDFQDVLQQGYSRMALVVPEVHIGNPSANAASHVRFLQEAYDKGACYALCPELGLTSYSCGDLFLNRTLQRQAIEALKTVVTASRKWTDLLVSVGLPIVVGDALYNCAVTLQNGRILAVVPKAYPPNYREFYEGRYFARAPEALVSVYDFAGQRRVPFGTDILIKAKNRLSFVLHTEVCEDMWVPVSPSTVAACGGATVLGNLSASNITIGKEEYRRMLVLVSSGKLNAAQLYCAAGFGESVSDLSWDGHGMIAERGTMLMESERYAKGGSVTLTDIDLDSLVTERLNQTSWHQNAKDVIEKWGAPRQVFCRHREADGHSRGAHRKLLRRIDPMPFVPSDPAKRDLRCRETFMIVSSALERRLSDFPVQNRKLVLGLSGGQDSTSVILDIVKTLDRMGLPRTNLIAVTMPGPGTTGRTYKNAVALAKTLGVMFMEVPIASIASPSFKIIGRDIDSSEEDSVFENTQAWTRKHILFVVAAQYGAMVAGTGDLSELAEGWCTMFGDHASHYNVNAGIPKTLVSYRIAWARDALFADQPAVQSVLTDILETPISPELKRPGKDGQIVQKSEDTVGPYDLIDFTIYHFVRWGCGSARIAFMALHAFGGKYDIAFIKHWLEKILKRFFAAQYKRNCVPDAPKVGLVALSPRGDWRMPSEAEVRAWILELEHDVPLALAA